MNNFLRSNGVNTGEVTIRVVSNTDKILKTRSGMKNRLVKPMDLNKSAKLIQSKAHVCILEACAKCKLRFDRRFGHVILNPQISNLLNLYMVAMCNPLVYIIMF